MSLYGRPASPVQCVQVGENMVACQLVSQPQPQLQQVAIVEPAPQQVAIVEQAPQQQLAIMQSPAPSQECVTVVRPQNIDTTPVTYFMNPQVTQGAEYGTSGFFSNGPQSLISNDPIINTLPMITRPLSNVGMPGQPPIQTALVTPGMYGTPYSNGISKPKQIDSRYPKKPVNLNRAIGFAVVMSCLCPPLGLFGLGTALSGRGHRYSNTRKAKTYRRASYGFSTMAVILIVLGVVIVVLLSQRYNKF